VVIPRSVSGRETLVGRRASGRRGVRRPGRGVGPRRGPQPPRNRRKQIPGAPRPRSGPRFSAASPCCLIRPARVLILNGSAAAVGEESHGRADGEIVCSSAARLGFRDSRSVY